jgi:uncharacterized protein (TIGR02996 family)
MPRYEDHATRTFREIAVHGKVVAIREGALGTSGNVRTETFATLAGARRRYEKLVAASALAGSASAGVAVPENPEMLAAIAREPDDDELRLVYADWLQASGNPRGELIALQARRDARSKARARTLLRRHAATLLGSFDERLASMSRMEARDVRLEWHLGFLRRVELRSAAVDPGLVTDLAALVSARFVRELVLGGSDDYRSVIRVLARTGWPACATRISIGHQRWGEYLPPRNQLGDVAAALRHYPRLGEADLTLGATRLRALDLPRLRRLVLRDVTPSQLATISAARWPALECLGLHVVEPRALAAALAIELRAPALRELELHAWRDDQLALLGEHLAAAPLARRVTRVRLIGSASFLRRLRAAISDRFAIERGSDPEGE